jgi:D-alanyl-D-alanine carboxypeptidase/D-alanyl-D-alanine-endopeptidase (penicillin-binding protein 4)
MTFVRLRVPAAALLVAVLAPVAGAQRLPLTTRLAGALAVRGAPASSSGAMAVDLLTGRTLFARHPDLPLAPASNEKLVVTYTALVALGPDYRFKTQVLSRGRLIGTVWHGNIILKGFGDPTLSSFDLLRLAAQLKRLGIRRVDGRVLGDDSWFDRQRTAPGWKPSFYLEESPPISSLVVDAGIYQHRIAVNPPLAAAGRFRQLLRQRGIETGPVGVGRAPAGAAVVGDVDSAPLSDVVRQMDIDSDNLAAEMLLKQLGAVVGTGGTSAAGAMVALGILVNARIPIVGVRIVDGSGLSEQDRLTARTIASLLLVAWRDQVLRGPLFHALPVAGVSGTLRYRLQRRPARGVVHAKTGTTDIATALSGYVRSDYAFALLQNGYPVSWSASREAQDRFATALASTPIAR